MKKRVIPTYPLNVLAQTASERLDVLMLSQSVRSTGSTSTSRRAEFVSILGPSGRGKSTIIGAIAGSTRLSAGELRLGLQWVAAPGPDRVQLSGGPMTPQARSAESRR